MCRLSAQIHIEAEKVELLQKTCFAPAGKGMSSAIYNILEKNMWHFRNALARVNYMYLKKSIYETTEYLETFLRNLLLNEKNALHN